MKCVITEFDRRLVDYELDIIAIIVQDENNRIVPIALPTKGTIFMTELGNLAYYDIWNNMVSVCREKFSEVIAVIPEEVFDVLGELKKHGEIDIDINKDTLLSPNTYFKIREIFKKN